MITGNMTLKEISNSSETMREFFRYLIVQGTDEEWSSLLSQVGQETCDMAVEALNHIQSCADKGISWRHPIGADGDAQLFYFPGKENAPYVLLCPGGAYMMVDLRGEGLPVAAALNRLGYHVFMLKYSVNLERGLGKQLEQVNAALEIIEDHAAEWKIDAARCLIMGLSAGGHLVSQWGIPEYGYEKYGRKKPAALILGYPAASTWTFYEDSVKKIGDEMYLAVAPIYLSLIYGKTYGEEDVKKHSLEYQINDKYPPTYMIHCYDDNLVHSTGIDHIQQSLEENHVPHKVVRVKEGGHGFGLGAHMDARGWLQDAIRFCEEV